MDSTEIYNYDAGGNSWINVNPYPTKVSGPNGITIDNKIIMTGTLIDFSSDSGNVKGFQWKIT